MGSGLVFGSRSLEILSNYVPATFEPLPSFLLRLGSGDDHCRFGMPCYRERFVLARDLRGHCRSDAAEPLAKLPTADASRENFSSQGLVPLVTLSRR